MSKLSVFRQLRASNVENVIPITPKDCLVVKMIGQREITQTTFDYFKKKKIG